MNDYFFTCINGLRFHLWAWMCAWKLCTAGEGYVLCQTQSFSFESNMFKPKIKGLFCIPSIVWVAHDQTMTSSYIFYLVYLLYKYITHKYHGVTVCIIPYSSLVLTHIKLSVIFSCWIMNLCTGFFIYTNILWHPLLSRVQFHSHLTFTHSKVAQGSILNLMNTVGTTAHVPSVR